MDGEEEKKALIGQFSHLKAKEETLEDFLLLPNINKKNDDTMNEDDENSKHVHVKEELLHDYSQEFPHGQISSWDAALNQLPRYPDVFSTAAVQSKPEVAVRNEAVSNVKKESDGVYKPLIKKKSKFKPRIIGKAKENDTVLKCPGCDFGTKTPSLWFSHFKLMHSTSCTQVGFALRCECGREAVSQYHSYVCEIAKLTVIRKEYGLAKQKPPGTYGTKNPSPTVRKDLDLQCPECEYRARTVFSWCGHLRFFHYTTPELAGFALLCDCGEESTSDEHSSICMFNVNVIRTRMGPIRRFDDVRISIWDDVFDQSTRFNAFRPIPERPVPEPPRSEAAEGAQPAVLNVKFIDNSKESSSQENKTRQFALQELEKM